MMDICLLLNEPTLPRWQSNALTALVQECDVTVTAIIYDDSAGSRTYPELVRRALELREWAPVAVVDQLLSRSNPWTDRIPLEEVVNRDSILELSALPETVDEWKQRIPEKPVERAAAESDIAIRFGFGFIVGPVLSAFDHGVLSYHHGDFRKYRGKPMGFWEFLNGEETAGITVQQLTDELDAGPVAAFKTVPIEDLQTWGAIQRRLYAQSEDMLAQAVRNVQNGELHEPTEQGEIYSTPSGLAVAKFAVKNAHGLLRSSVRSTSAGTE